LITPNFQRPTPKGKRSRALAESRRNRLVAATFTFSFEPRALGVGSWKLGVVIGT
jgi:hypothetical protein